MRRLGYATGQPWCRVMLMSQPPAHTHNPRWFMVPLRVLLFTFLMTLLAFAVVLLLAIIAIATFARLRGSAADFAFAYRYVAAPAAAVAGTVVLVLSCTLEVRHYRQARALAALERAGTEPSAHQRH